MNLEDLIDEKGLQQDEWSLTRPRFGDEGQLEVVGWSGRYKSNKFYILKCENCSMDSELFGQGYFKAKKSHLTNMAATPCGCSKRVNWTEDQFKTLCHRKAEQAGFEFIGFSSNYFGAYTQIKLLCKLHGMWESTNINNFLNNRGCPACQSVTISGLKSKSDETMISSFLATAKFPDGTKFWRSDRENNRGKKVYWFIYCPECEQIGETSSSNLQQGQKCCGCSFQPTECYINLILDQENVIAIKFGVSTDSIRRLKHQNSSCIYQLKQHSVYKFADSHSCKRAEKDCKSSLTTCVLNKMEMPDGYTETTWAYNLEKIIEIYERNGGVRQETT